MATLFGWLFSGAWAWILGKIGASPEEKLGRAEATEAGQAKQLEEVRKANESDALSNRIGDDALKLQLARFKRTDG